jgi:tripartite-type tricarboxylate transporter receptor subunit TctC
MHALRWSGDTRRSGTAGVLQRAAAMLFGSLFCVSLAWAQAYPNKPIRIIAPFPPGGSADLTARIVADHLTRSLGQPVVVENVPGAGGLIAAERIAKAAPDGYTLIVGSTGIMSVNASLLAKLPYDIVKDFTPISIVIRVPSYLVVHPKVPVNSVRELIDYARRNPDKLTYASAGNGTSQHTNPELFKSMASVSIRPIPYRGSAACTNALVAGEVDMMIELGPTIIPQIKAGRVKVLGASTANRTRAMPEVPTISEAGLPGFDAFTWFAIAGPGNMPRDIVTRLHAEIVNAVAPPEVRARLEAVGAEVVANTPEEFTEFQAKEIAKWAKVIRESGIKPE